MRRSTHGAFSEIEPQMPRVCGPKPNSPFLPNPTPPPLPSRLQPPPLPPKHRSMGVTIKKYKPNAETSDSYGRDVYESISDAPISPQPKCITGHPGPYVPRDLCVHTIAPNTMRRSCVSRKPAGPPLCSGAGAFEVGYSPTFAIDPNTGIPRGPCTCNLGASAKQSSPVWSKMNPDDSASFIRTQPSSPEQTVFNSRPSKSTSGSVPNILDKKSGDSDSRPSTVARFSRTVSRFFRRKSSSRKNKSVRSCSVFFTEGDDKLIKNPSVSPPSNVGFFIFNHLSKLNLSYCLCFSFRYVRQAYQPNNLHRDIAFVLPHPYDNNIRFVFPHRLNPLHILPPSLPGVVPQPATVFFVAWTIRNQFPHVFSCQIPWKFRVEVIQQLQPQRYPAFITYITSTTFTMCTTIFTMQRRRPQHLPRLPHPLVLRWRPINHQHPLQFLLYHRKRQLPLSEYWKMRLLPSVILHPLISLNSRILNPRKPNNR